MTTMTNRGQKPTYVTTFPLKFYFFSWLKKQYLTWKWSWSSLSLRICHQRLRKRGLHALNKGQIQILCGIRRRRDFGACQGRSRGGSLNDTRIITYYKRKDFIKMGSKNRSDIILAIFFLLLVNIVQK